MPEVQSIELEQRGLREGFSHQVEKLPRSSAGVVLTHYGKLTGREDVNKRLIVQMTGGHT